MQKNLYQIFFDIQKKHWWFVAKKKIILDHINRYVSISKDQKILDVGCGPGLMLSALENIGHTYGMDASDDAISFSKEYFHGEVKKGMLPNAIPYEKNFFDLIIALDVVEHVDEDVAALESLRNHLSSKGKAILTVPAYMFLWSEHDVLNEHKRRYTLSEFESKIKQAGFQIEKISYFNHLLFPLIYLIRKINNWRNKTGPSDVEMPSFFINKILSFIFGLEMYLLRFFNLPFGVSIIAVVKK